MQEESPKALVVSGDAKWRKEWSVLLSRHGYRVHTTRNGLEGVGCLRQSRYECIVVDDSIEGMGVVEFVLYVPELAPYQPLLFAGGEGLDRFSAIWARCKVNAATTKDVLAGAILEALESVSTNWSGRNSH